MLKGSFNSVLLPLLFFFFCRYQTSSFCITLSHRALQLAYVEKVHLPLPGDDGGVVIVGLLILIISVGLLTGWVRMWVGRRAPLLKPVWKPVLNCRNLVTWFSYIAVWRINSKVTEGSMIPSGTVVQHVKVHAWLYQNYAWTLQVTLPARARFVTFLIVRPMYPMTDDSWCARMFFNLETAAI